MERIPSIKFLERSAGVPVLDVRSPAEYGAGHIPGAVSFPLFTDEERAVIGTLYKQQGRQDAIKMGLDIVGPKMKGFVERAESLQSQEFAMYCWRGGMRSDSMAWLLERYGFKVALLEGGYKAYRNHLLEFFDRPLPLRVLTGYTGSKKTLLLHLMREKGAQVIDLEGLAGHQGSSFGNKKCEAEQPSTEYFQNLVFEAFLKLDLERPIWIEDENMRVGKVNITESLYRQKSDSPHFVVEADKAKRLEFLVEDYGKVPREKLIEATEAIGKKLGYDRAVLAIEHIRNGELKEAVDIILHYYDARYERSISEKKHLVQARIKTDLADLEELASQLLNFETYVH